MCFREFEVHQELLQPLIYLISCTVADLHLSAPHQAFEGDTEVCHGPVWGLCLSEERPRLWDVEVWWLCSPDPWWKSFCCLPQEAVGSSKAKWSGVKGRSK